MEYDIRPEAKSLICFFFDEAELKEVNWILA